MNVVDSSAWLEYFADSDQAEYFAPPIEDIGNLIVPVICIYEVFKKLLQTHGQTVAEVRIADMFKGKVVDLTSNMALNAALLSVQYHLPMADSLILSTAQEYNATLWTEDEHFQGIAGVRYFDKKAKRDG
ncbi:MAG: type II toxin-antitoxin system VapC family toxin [Chloroflexota bacterium]